MDVLQKIDELRKERGWSVNYMAMEAMLTQSTVNNLYKRKTEPKLSTLRALCNAFGISLAEFFAEDKRFADDEEEIVDRVKKLTPQQKRAVLELLRCMG